MSTKHDLTIFRGDTLDQPFKVWANDAETVDFDLTGWTVTGQIRGKPDNYDLDGEFTIDVTDAAAGEFTASLTAAETTDFPTGDRVYDIQIEAGPDRYTVVYGTFTVRADVTR
jgi:hypothetical protein